MRGVTVTVAEVLKGLEEMGIELRDSKGGQVVAVVDGTEVKVPAQRPRQAIDARLLPAFGTVLPRSLGSRMPSGSRAAVDETDVWLRSAFSGSILGVEAVKTLGSVRRSILGALSELRRWPPERTKETWSAPDDKGYEPRRYDPVTTGPLRVTGDTARLAVQRTTATKGQLEEREAT